MRHSLRKVERSQIPWLRCYFLQQILYNIKREKGLRCFLALLLLN